MTNPSAPWEQLFPPESSGVEFQLRLARKHGDALLLLPAETRLARRALALFPAQTAKARLARALLALAPSLGTESVSLRINAQSDFAGFISKTLGTKSLPRFAMLLGNPRAPGRRFVLMLFNEAGSPAALVKAGVGQPAMDLIANEVNFIKSQPPGLLHSPQIYGAMESAHIGAFGMELLEGETPSPVASEQLAKLLNSWLRPDLTANCLDLPALQRLQAALAPSKELSARLTPLRDAKLHPAIHHGDFAPWNVRVDSSGEWRVLDWERGESQGPPAWDWFHWVIQHEVLVRRSPAASVLARVDALLASSEFRAYAGRAGIIGCERTLLLAYVMYCLHVIHQADGTRTIEELLHRLVNNPATR